jgi:predicted AAA+ superfamily ATPase
MVSSTPRTYWLDRIERAWQHRSIIWLSGVRRVGKTCLVRSLPDVEYFDCELPSVRRQLVDPESFLRGLAGRRVALDEIHRLSNPSELLKIAADHFPEIRVIATGSSTLQASTKFRDTLTDRQTDIWLTPMATPDLRDFERPDLLHRLTAGGLPPFFLDDERSPGTYQEWIDSYWAKDVQELFRLERRHAFQRLIELIMTSSGGIFEASRFAAPMEASRQTVNNYLAVLEATRVAQVVRPFSSRQSTEIVSAPKVYAFDTGFVGFYRGWRELRPEDLDILWEHFVLNEIQALLPGVGVHYWRDKQHHEIDFVVPFRGNSPVTIECKWLAGAGLDAASLASFRRRYPGGPDLAVAHNVDRPFTSREGGLPVSWVGLDEMTARLRAYAAS